MGALFRHTDRLLRVAGLFAAGVLAFLVLQALLVPKGLASTATIGPGARGNQVRRLPSPGAPRVSVPLDVPEAMKGGGHAAVRCEACHGPLAGHAGDPVEKKAVRPDSKVLCARCHAANAARPAKFPQVEVAEHVGGEACTTCHVAHNPGMIKEATK
jgi:hypothetical protein